jgi:transcriptional regulator with XRE-family HTH domain
MISVGTHLNLAGQLRELRSRTGITTREVAEQSQKIAEAENNPEFYISNAWLTQLENTDSIPSVFKLFSLSVIYRVKFSDLLLLFGIDLERIEKHRIGMPPQDTVRATIEVYDNQRTVTFPIRFDPGFTVSTTNLLSRMVEVWGEIPIAMIQHLDLRHEQYGYIGLQDFTLHPLLRPGSFVQINERVKKIQPGKWRTEFDRPIYFVELRDGYACGWCEVNRNDLLLIPHPLSPCSVKQYAYGTEAEIVGQVTGVAMRLVDTDSHGDSETSKLLKR